MLLKLQPFLSILVLLLLLFLLQQNACNNKSTTTVKRDTVINVLEGGRIPDAAPLPIAQAIPATREIHTLVYQPVLDPADSILRILYRELLDSFVVLRGEHYQTRITKDSLLLDTVGKVHITDSIAGGRVWHRWQYSLNLPTIRETVTRTETPRNRWAVGGGMAGGERGWFYGKAGLQVETPKGRTYGLNGVYLFTGEKGVELSTYWRIR